MYSPLHSKPYRKKERPCGKWHTAPGRTLNNKTTAPILSLTPVSPLSSMHSSSDSTAFRLVLMAHIRMVLPCLFVVVLGLSPGAIFLQAGLENGRECKESRGAPGQAFIVYCSVCVCHSRAWKKRGALCTAWKLLMDAAFHP
jgi:hypothetical protein